MLTPDDISWIQAHMAQDPDKLLLKHGGDPRFVHLIMQVTSRKKYSRKLHHTLQCNEFEFPTYISGEQSTSDALAAFHTSLINPDESIADLTAGLGIDTFHLAGKASSVTAIERDSAVASTLNDNASALNIKNISVINADCTDWIRHTVQNFTSIFIDPARRGDSGERIFALSQCSPDVTAMLPHIAAHAPRLIVKMSPMLDIVQTTRELTGLTDIYAVGTTDECKELVAIVDTQRQSSAPYRIHAVTLAADGTTLSHHTFTSNQEYGSPVYGLPDDARFIYEPFPAIMKTAPFRRLTQEYDVTALHPNTHLYASPRLIADFPGSAMAIDEIMPFGSSALKQLQKRKIKASVSVRNFGMTAAELRSRIKNSESAACRLLGVTIASTGPDASRILIMTHPVK